MTQQPIKNPMVKMPYTMDMYRMDLAKMMRNPMSTGQGNQTSQPNSIADNLRNLIMAGTAMAGTTY